MDEMDISVIIPALNEEDNIEVCLKSVCSQRSDFKYEVIVADCQSEDKTSEIAEKYADKVIFSQERSIGIARNTGAKVSEGRFLVFIDADTIIPQNYLKKVREKFSEDKELLGFSASFKFSKRNPHLILTEKFTNSYLSFRDKIKMTTLLGFNTCVKKSSFNQLNGFRDVPLEDGEFSIRLRRIGKVSYFTDFFVITSPRRLEDMGLLGTLDYYFQMDLARRSTFLKKFLTYNSYLPCRINENSLEKEFFRIYTASSLSPDLSIKEYIQKKAEALSETINKTKKWSGNKKQFLDKIIKTSKSIAELKLIPKLTKTDVDQAIKLIKEKMKKNKF